MKNKFNKFQIRKFIQRSLTTVLIITGTVLSACAEVEKRETAMQTVLEKEVALIEKIKIERRNPKVTEEIQKSAILVELENHLFAGLDEISKSNATLSNLLIKKQQEQNVKPLTKEEYNGPKFEGHFARWR